MRDFEVLGSRFLEDRFVSEAGNSRSDIMLLAHLEVLTEVLVTAPPVSVDHVETLVTSNLMEVGIPNIVLDAIDRVSSIAMRSIVGRVALANSIAPMLNHSLFLVLYHDPEKETVPKMPGDHAPKESNAVLLVEWINLPVKVSERVFSETSQIFEGPPPLGIVEWFLGVVNKLAKISVCIFGESSVEMEILLVTTDLITYLPIMSALSLMFGTP